ncbi:cytochrome P460 family protein [Phenylobacterium sp.]|uniref:cytochrome P460 family protein n=1 Tax=Phenylobacterium sp. TaxID=1871053 RepID=UPI001216A0DC|nr:cytochrome P460 family protein [Phenylobacterium sp.]THD62947.1 MAG: cytochrome P460 [Phenylobacterium sp.]
MKSGVLIAAAFLAGGLAVSAASHAQPQTPAVAYTADGKLQFPKDYRSWVYLSSGMDMAYTDSPGMADHHMFDNVFVNREAYAVFQKTGTWPDKTIFMLEARAGEQRGSINKKGLFQGDTMGREAHVKDTTRFKSGWAFFPFAGGEQPATALPQTSGCNACHEQHGAVDTTFVQFYPTLMPKAEEMKTLSAAYLAEQKAESEKR